MSALVSRVHHSHLGRKCFIKLYAANLRGKCDRALMLMLRIIKFNFRGEKLRSVCTDSSRLGREKEVGWGRVQLRVGKRGLSNVERMQGTWSGRWTHFRHPLQGGFPLDYEWPVLNFWHQTPWRKTCLIEAWKIVGKAFTVLCCADLT